MQLMAKAKGITLAELSMQIIEKDRQQKSSHLNNSKPQANTTKE
jgi:hypothetical protein